MIEVEVTTKKVYKHKFLLPKGFKFTFALSNYEELFTEEEIESFHFTSCGRLLSFVSVNAYTSITDNDWNVMLQDFIVSVS
jgi:hypothetical protein